MRFVTVGAVLAGVVALAACGGAPGDYYAVPPAVALAQLEAVTAPTGTGELTAIRDGNEVHLTLAAAGQTLAVLHAAVSSDGDGSRVVITEDPVVAVASASASTASNMDRVNADVNGILHSRLNRQMMGDMLREQVAATLAHRAPDFRSVLWRGARAIGRDASLVRDFADRVDEMQTDAARAAWDAQKAEAEDAVHSTPDVHPDRAGRPTPGVGQPMIDTRPSTQWTGHGDQE